MQYSLENRIVWLLLAPLMLVMLAFFLLPAITIALQSLGEGRPSLEVYRSLAGSVLLRRVLLTTFEISVTATAVSLVIGYAMAMHLVRQPPKRRAFFMVLVMLPFWTSILVKSYAFTVVLGEAGLVNVALRALSGGAVSLELLFNRTGVVIGMTNYLLPFMVLPILANLLALDPALRRAAETMGAGPLRIFWAITLPLTLPGILSGVLMCLTLSIGMYITPSLLGGRSDMMMANLIDFYTRQILDWPTASAIAVILLALSGGLVLLLARVRGGNALL